MNEELLKEFNKELITLLNKYNLKLTVDELSSSYDYDLLEKTVEINLRDTNTNYAIDLEYFLDRYK